MIKYIDSRYRYGFHVEKFPSMIKTVSKVTETPLSAMQLYISNSRSKAPPKFDYQDMKLALNILDKQDIYMVIHGSLLYNLAGTVNGTSDGPHYHQSLDSTLRGLIAELDYGAFFGAGVIVHPGSQKDKEEGIKTIAKTIEIALTRETDEAKDIAERFDTSVEDVIGRRKIILENSSGEGSKICSTLEEIAQVIQLVDLDLRRQIKVCIDTAHAFGKGLYDWGISSEIDKFYSDFDKIIGLQYLELFHFNDSKRSDDKRLNAPFGSKKDRHEQLGKGYIFDENDGSRYQQITKFMIEAMQRNIPVIGEPPVSGMDDWNVVEKLLLHTEYPIAQNVIVKIKK